MVAILNPGTSIRRAFLYNENKVKEGAASILLTENYPLPFENLTEHLRLNMLLKLAGMNTSAKVNAMHITLNFSPDEQLPDSMVKEIAKVYMDRIGFGNQPYIAYRHFDAGHPHLHIVTTNIEITGKRIDLHHLGIRRSEPARKYIEQQYNLVRAEDQKNDFSLKPAHNGKVIYGRSDSRRAIANVLSNLLTKYRYTSLAELNALLKLYNIRADGGLEGSRINRNKGLLYHILDKDGKAIGVPIKASSFYNKPTLKYLGERFSRNEIDRRPYKNQLRKKIDFALHAGPNLSVEQFIKSLGKEGVHVSLRQNEAGTIYGLTYIDHNTACIFNGSALGKDYSAKGILERCEGNHQQNRPIDLLKTPTTISTSDRHVKETSEGVTYPNGMLSKPLIEELMQAENGGYTLPYELSGKKKRRRKRKPKS